MSDINPTKPRFPRLRKIGKLTLFGAIALALCVGLAVWHSRVEIRRAWAEIQKRLDALRAAGEPVTAEDLAKLYPNPPPDRDAALLLAPATAALWLPDPDIDPQSVHNWAWSGSQDLTEPLLATIQTVVDTNQAALNAVPWDRITNAWFGPGFSRGFSNMVANPDSPDTELPRLFCLKAILEARAGNASQAIENLSRALALLRTIRNGSMAHLYYRRKGEALVCVALEWVVNRTEILPDDLRAFEHLLSDDHTEGLREALISLRCRNIWAMNSFRADPINEVLPRSSYGNKLGNVLRYHYYATLIQTFDRIYSDADFSEMLDARSAQIAALKLPLKQRFSEFERIERVAVEGGHPSIASRGSGAARVISTRLRWDAEVRAKMQVTRVALEVERWRLAHGGRAPDSLADLVPEFAPSVPLDPFDNNPLRYKKLARGFLLYSIGADFTDDGGKEKKGDLTGYENDSDHYDITFSVER